jgi:hypothetical protein
MAASLCSGAAFVYNCQERLCLMCELCNLFKKSYNIPEYKAAHLCLNHLKIIIMPLLTVLGVLVVVGVILWLINTYIPMQRTIKNILNAVVVIVVVIWLLNVFGVLSSIKSVRI